VLVETGDGLEAGLDDASAEWVGALTSTGAEREAALTRLHDMLVRIAATELGRRQGRSGITGPERDDLAHQAAADAMLAILAKLPTFRGESRFTTWAYRFVILEVSSKLGRHYWVKHPAVSIEEAGWERLPDRVGMDPADQTEHAEMVAILRKAIDETLTEHQRQLFVALVLNGVPIDALADHLGTNRNAIYKAIFDARRKIRAFLVANGYLPEKRSL
jgi:RNA polymerase sigma-70 factor, ECF subfamily